MDIQPLPSEEETAAIVAALDAVTSRGIASADGPPTSRWRFSGRWWTKPIPLRRDRPW